MIFSKRNVCDKQAEFPKTLDIFNSCPVSLFNFCNLNFLST